MGRPRRAAAIASIAARCRPSSRRGDVGLLQDLVVQAHRVPTSMRCPGAYRPGTGAGSRPGIGAAPRSAAARASIAAGTTDQAQTWVPAVGVVRAGPRGSAARR